MFLVLPHPSLGDIFKAIRQVIKAVFVHLVRRQHAQRDSRRVASWKFSIMVIKEGGKDSGKKHTDC
jgi:hypothetical protein